MPDIKVWTVLERRAEIGVETANTIITQHKIKMH